MTIALPEGLSNLVAERVASGQYASTSEYICGLIRRNQREQKIARLGALVEEGSQADPGARTPKPTGKNLTPLPAAQGLMRHIGVRAHERCVEVR